MPKLYFLRGAIGAPSLIQAHKEAINSLLRGTYTDSQLEKLKGHDVFSFRLSKKKRLLFAMHPIGGALRLVVLDYLPTHKYERSRFLQSSVLKRYLNQPEHSETSIVFEETSERPVLPVGDDETQEIDWQVMDYHNQKLIELSLEQQAVMQVRLPALISGGAGSGKSCAALSLLSSWCSRRCVARDMRDDGDLAPIVYVSQSKALVDSMHRSWMELPLSGERAEGVLFLTYDELLHRELREDTTSPLLKFVGRPEFTSWYQFVTTGRKRETKAKQQDFTFLDEESAYQEFRILSGCSSQKDYLSLGKRESLLSPEDPREKEMTYAIYQAYLKHLKDVGQIQPAFHSFTPKNHYSMVVVDEAQDFSHLQLIQLGRLAHGSAVFCMDGHQSIHDRRTPRAFVLKQFEIKGESHIQLNLTHRCPEQIVTVANQVLLLKHKLQGGTGDQYAPTRIDRAPSDGGLGHVFLIEPDQVRDNAWLNTQIGQSHCAIVTTPKHLEAARSLFETPLVFTPETIKGLEFPVVVAYKLYKPTLFREANARLQELVVQKEPQHRPKQGCGDERFAPGLSQIYTAYTRAQCVLVVSEENNKINEILLVPLRGLAEREAPSEACLQHETFAQDWNKRVIELLDMGNKALALTLFISKLEGTEATFDALVEQRRVPATLKPKPESPPPQASAATPVLGTNTFRKLLTALNVSPPPVKSVATSSSSPPSPDQSRAVTKQRQIAKGVLGLVENFRRGQLGVVMNFSDDGGKDVWLASYDHKDGTKFCLADLLNDKTKSDVLMCCLVNNTDLLINKMPYEAILKCITNDVVRSDIHILMKFRTMVKKVQKLMIAANIVSTAVSIVDCAVNLDDVRSIHILHRMGADLNKPGKNDDVTPIFNAVLMGYAGVITALGDCGACLDTLTGGITPTFVAAQQGCAAAIVALTAGRADLNVPNRDGATPACIAAQNGHAYAIVALTAGRANLNTPNLDGATPACIAAYNGHAYVITALKAGGADLDRPMPTGATPAYIAAQNGHARVIVALAAGGANLNLQNKDGATPACIAAQNGHAHVITALYAGGADLNTQDIDGATPACIAAQNGHAHVITALNAGGADLNRPIPCGATPTYIAAQKGHAHVIAALIAGCANLNAPNNHGATPLYIAAQNGHADVVAALIAGGADLNAAVKGGATPAFIAAGMGHAGVITLLKAAGANMDAPMQNGETPASIAEKKGHRKVSIALQAGGSLSQCRLFRPPVDAAGQKVPRTETSPESPDYKFPK